MSILSGAGTQLSFASRFPSGVPNVQRTGRFLRKSGELTKAFGARDHQWPASRGRKPRVRRRLFKNSLAGRPSQARIVEPAGVSLIKPAQVEKHEPRGEAPRGVYASNGQLSPCRLAAPTGVSGFILMEWVFTS